jgi:threonine dehydratase
VWAWLKLEYMQHTGWFKAWGAFNRILAAAEAGDVPASGVVAASGGVVAASGQPQVAYTRAAGESCRVSTSRASASDGPYQVR